MRSTLREQFTQTLITHEDVERLIQGLKLNKKLLVDVDSQWKLQDSSFIAEHNAVTLEVPIGGGCIGKISEEDCSKISGELTAEICPSEQSQISISKYQRRRSLRKKCTSSENATSRVIPASVIKQLYDSTSETCAIDNRVSSLKAGRDAAHGTATKPVQEFVHRRQKGGNVSCVDGDAEPYKCSYCNKQYASKKNLRAHLLIHEKCKEHACASCGKKFLRTNELRLHARTHTGEKPFSCSTCEKAFTNSSALARHQTIHNREKEDSSNTTVSKGHTCPHCGKTFTQKGNLTVHMKIHTGTYDHICSICQKSFITSGDLKRHVRVHTKEKPYRCDVCKKSFSTSSTLVCHKRSHSGERPYLCGVCGASFSILGHLKQHNRIHVRGDTWPRKKSAKSVEEKTRKRAGSSKQKGNSCGSALIREEVLSVVPTSEAEEEAMADGQALPIVAEVTNSDDRPVPGTAYTITHKNSENSSQSVIIGSTDNASSLQLISDIGNIQPISVTSEIHEIPGEIQIIISNSESNIELSDISGSGCHITASEVLVTTPCNNSQYTTTVTDLSVPIALSIQLPNSSACTSISLPMESTYTFSEIANPDSMTAPDTKYLQSVTTVPLSVTSTSNPTSQHMGSQHLSVIAENSDMCKTLRAGQQALISTTSKSSDSLPSMSSNTQLSKMPGINYSDCALSAVPSTLHSSFATSSEGL